MINIPITLNKFFQSETITKEQFKSKWSKLLCVFSSELLSSNRKIANKIEDYQKYFEFLIKLNEEQINKNSKKKLGGRFYLNFSQNSFLIKVILIGDRKIIIKVASEKEEDSLMKEYILDTLVYLFCKEEKN